MTPQQVLNQSEADLKAYARASPEPELEETFQEIWKAIQSSRLYAGQPRNEVTSRCVTLARSALRLADSANNDALFREAWRIVAYALTADEQYAEAIQYYARAVPSLEEAGEHALAARSRLGFVAALFHAGRYEEALAVASVAERWFRDANDESGYARLCQNVGNIYHRLDDHQRAYAYHSQSVEAFEKMGDRQCSAQGYLNLGNVLACTDRFDEAASMYERAERTSLELGLTDLWAQSAYNRSYLWFLRGRYSEALHSLDELRKRFAESGSVRHSALCDLDRAEIYMQLNLSQDVIALAREAASQFQQIHLEYERAKAITFTGVAHAQTLNFTSALDAFESAESIFEREGNSYWVAMLHVYRAEVLLSLGRLDEARTLAQAAAATFDRLNIPSRKGQCLTLLGRIACTAGDQASAERYMNELSAIMQDHEVPLIHFSYRMLCGEVALSAQRKDEARGHYERAAEDLEHSQSKVDHDDLRLGLLRGSRLVYERLVSLWLEQLDRDQSVENAYFWCEKAKSRGLIELLSAHMPRVQSSAGEAELKKLARLREELSAAYARVKPEQPITASSAYGAIAAKENELARTLREVSHIDPDYVSLQQVSGVSFDDIQRSLPPHTALVEYFATEDRVMVFVISPSGYEVFPNLCRVDRIHELQERLSFQIEKFLLSRELVDTYADSILLATNEHLHELYSELFKPFGQHLEAEHLFIVGHGMLHFLPFHALYDGERYLIDRYTISYASSASVLQSCWNKKDVSGASPVLFGASDERVRCIDAEIAEVSGLFSGSRAFTGGDAKCTTFLDEARSAEFVHVAAHSLFRHDNPMFSGFKLADGWLNAIDLYSMRCETNLVTLSGCRSGLCGIAGGDDLVGLIRGFLYAGARSLLVSLWHVDDRAACDLMQNFYAEWRNGKSKAAALRNAMLAVRNEYPHPVFWAPFSLVGKA
jgi:tetratricopeptide (TPR) repeat protein